MQHTCSSRRCVHRLARPFAEVGDDALLAQRPAGHAGITAVQDQPVMGVQPVALRHDFQQLHFDVERGLADRQPGAIANAEDVGVDGDGRLAEGDVEHDVGGLAADARQGFQRLAVVRNFAAVFFNELARKTDDIFGLGAKKADGLDQIAHLGFAELCHLLRRIGEREQSWRRLVDPGVGRLRRQHDGDQERKWINVLQFAARRRVGGGETAERFLDLGFGPLRQFAVGGLYVGLGLRLATLETRRLALAGGLQSLLRLLLLGCFARHLAGIIAAMADDTSSNDLSAEPAIFSAIITPHRSLSSTGFVIFMLCIGGISFAAGMVFLMLGAWPVFGFFGLDVALVYWAFRANYRSARAYEEVTVTATELTVRKISQRGVGGAR